MSNHQFTYRTNGGSPSSKPSPQADIGHSTTRPAPEALVRQFGRPIYSFITGKGSVTKGANIIVKNAGGYTYVFNANSQRPLRATASPAQNTIIEVAGTSGPSTQVIKNLADASRKLGRFIPKKKPTPQSASNVQGVPYHAAKSSHSREELIAFSQNAERKSYWLGKALSGGTAFFEAASAKLEMMDQESVVQDILADFNATSLSSSERTEKNLKIEEHLRKLCSYFKEKGYAKAAFLLEHGLDAADDPALKDAKEAPPVILSKKDALQDYFFAYAHEANRKQIARLLTRGSDFDSMEITFRKWANIADIFNLKDGEALRGQSFQARTVRTVNDKRSQYFLAAAFGPIEVKDSVLAHGRTFLNADVHDLTLCRLGDRILFDGTVNFDGSEKYDFNNDSAIGEALGASHLERQKQLKPFEVIIKWQESFSGQMHIVPGKKGDTLKMIEIIWPD